MLPIPDALAGFYLVCFGIGLLFTLVSLIFGMGHDILDLPGFHSDGVGGHDAGDVSDGGGDGSSHGVAHVSPINVGTLMGFLAWFGGAGYLLRVYGGVVGVISLGAASLFGLAGGAILFYFLAKVILPGQTVLDPGDYRMEGTVAKVTVPITAERPGEIVYSMGGSRRSDGAISETGSPIGRGTEVVVVRYEHGIAYVEPWNSFVKKG